MRLVVKLLGHTQNSIFGLGAYAIASVERAIHSSNRCSQGFCYVSDPGCFPALGHFFHRLDVELIPKFAVSTVSHRPRHAVHSRPR